MGIFVALIIVALVVIILLMLIFSAIRVVQQYERGVIFVLGKLTGAKGPGIFLVPPFITRMNKINRELQTIIDESTERWGVKVTAVEIKDVELPASMQRAMAKQAEAEREKRAKIIHAEGELQASAQLAQAA